MSVVPVSSTPEGQEAPHAPGKVVAAVGIDCLEETRHNPQIHGDEVKISRQIHPECWGTDSAQAEEHGLDRRRILRRKSEWRAIVVVQLVDGLIERAVVQGSVEEVVPGILHDEEDTNLKNNLPPGREWHAIVEAPVCCQGMEEPNLGKLDGDVAEKNDAGAVKLVVPGRHLCLFPQAC